ncbi:MAG: hypothetical protein J6Q38_04095 [Clostridia bacterium]|nr:hypothetical protein [Clostridia bacterium]
MKTREESLNNFCSLMDKLMASKYLLAQSSIFEVITLIGSSKLLNDMFTYFLDGFNFEEALTSAFYMENGAKYFRLPENKIETISLVYALLKEINYKKIQLSDLLDFFDSGKNYEASYQKFSSEVLLPFKSYTYQIAIEMINGTQVLENEKVTFNKQIEKENDTKYSIIFDKSADYATLRRLLDLDKLSITQSRLSDDDKEELRYILSVFEEEIKGGNVEKIRLAYFAYYYAMRPLKKVKNNLKTITEIFIKAELL